MSKRCQLPQCTKTSMKVTNRKLLRGNYNPTSRYTQKSNTQKFTLSDGSKIWACTKCIRSLNKAAKV